MAEGGILSVRSGGRGVIETARSAICPLAADFGLVRVLALAPFRPVTQG